MDRQRFLSIATSRFKSFRRSRGIPLYAPYVGRHPALVDAWNYLSCFLQPDPTWPEAIHRAKEATLEAASALWEIIPGDDLRELIHGLERS